MESHGHYNLSTDFDVGRALLELIMCLATVSSVLVAGATSVRC